MGKYRVLPISMSLKNNKVASAGDIVDETQLNSPVHELLKDKFIEVADDETSAKSQVVDSPKEGLTEAKNSYALAKEAFDALTPETSDKDKEAATNSLKAAITSLKDLGEDVSELEKVFDIVDENQNVELDKLKADFLAAVKEKTELPKDAKPAQLAKAGEKILDLKTKLVEAGVEFDDKGEIVNSPAQN